MSIKALLFLEVHSLPCNSHREASCTTALSMSLFYTSVVTTEDETASTKQRRKQAGSPIKAHLGQQRGRGGGGKIASASELTGWEDSLFQLSHGLYGPIATKSSMKNILVQPHSFHPVRKMPKTFLPSSISDNCKNLPATLLVLDTSK